MTKFVYIKCIFFYDRFYFRNMTLTFYNENVHLPPTSQAVTKWLFEKKTRSEMFFILTSCFRIEIIIRKKTKFVKPFHGEVKSLIPPLLNQTVITQSLKYQSFDGHSERHVNEVSLILPHISSSAVCKTDRRTLFRFHNIHKICIISLGLYDILQKLKTLEY